MSNLTPISEDPRVSRATSLVAAQERHVHFLEEKLAGRHGLLSPSQIKRTQTELGAAIRERSKRRESAVEIGRTVANERSAARQMDMFATG